VVAEIVIAGKQHNLKPNHHPCIAANLVRNTPKEMKNLTRFWAKKEAFLPSSLTFKF
jgi:hypothetical protein